MSSTSHPGTVAYQRGMEAGRRVLAEYGPLSPRSPRNPEAYGYTRDRYPEVNIPEWQDGFADGHAGEPS